jgi:glycerol uptake facilitator-like aquaporin
MDTQPPAALGGIIYNDKSQLRTILLYEFLGTAIVTYAFTLSGGNLFTRAIAYFIVFIFAAHVSGAHCNPATTFACYVYDKLSGLHAKSEVA